MNFVNATDSSDWPTVDVGYETFKISPKYSQNPDTVRDDIYEWDYDVDEFTVRYVNPRIMNLYGYHLEKYSSKTVKVSGHDAVHFYGYDRHDKKNNSCLCFSSGEEFYYINFRGNNMPPEIKEIVKSCSPSKYTHEEFYKILDEEYQNYKIVNAIESQRFDYTSNPKGFSYTSFGPDGIEFGSARYY